MNKKNVLLTALAIAGFAVTSLAQTVPNYVPSNGLVGWWPFNGNAIDESINTNDGTVNGATLTTDRFGSANSAYSFDGITNYINCGNNPNLQLNNFTFSLWANLDSTSGNWNNGVNSGGFLIYKGCDNPVFPFNGYSYRVFYAKPYGLLTDQFTTNRAFLDNNLSSLFGNWSNIIYSYDGAYLRLYFNGIKIDSLARNGNTSINSNDLLVGCRKEIINNNCTLDDYFKGQLDDIGIWNRALTQQEITGLYNGNLCFQTITVTDTLLINTNFTGFNPVTYQNTIKIWPNPTNDHITIDNGNLANLTGHQIKISNALGQQVFQSAITQQQFYVNMSTWGGNGIYFVNLINAQGVTIETRKIVLQ
jgi:hypothetical protein